MQEIETLLTTSESSVSSISSAGTSLETEAGDNCSIFDSLAAFARNLSNSSGLSSILSDIQTATANAIKKIKDIAVNLKDTLNSFKQFYENSKAFFNSLLGFARDKAIQFFTKVKDAFGSVKAYIDAVVSNIKTAFSNLKDSFIDGLKKFKKSKCVKLNSVAEQFNPTEIVGELNSVGTTTNTLLSGMNFSDIPAFDINVPDTPQSIVTA